MSSNAEHPECKSKGYYGKKWRDSQGQPERRWGLGGQQMWRGKDWNGNHEQQKLRPNLWQPSWGWSKPDQAGGSCHEGEKSAPHERHVKNASPGRQKSELCKHRTHLRVPEHLSGSTQVYHASTLGCTSCQTLSSLLSTHTFLKDSPINSSSDTWVTVSNSTCQSITGVDSWTGSKP